MQFRVKYGAFFSFFFFFASVFANLKSFPYYTLRLCSILYIYMDFVLTRTVFLNNAESVIRFYFNAVAFRRGKKFYLAKNKEPEGKRIRTLAAFLRRPNKFFEAVHVHERCGFWPEEPLAAESWPRYRRSVLRAGRVSVHRPVLVSRW